jgi:flagellar protein FliO/FliZ
MDMSTSTPFGGSELLGFASSLIIVIGVIAILGWLYSRSKSLGGANSDVINIVASRALGTRERLLLVEIADKQLLVGMTTTQVQTLHVFDKPIVEPPAINETYGFAGRLKTALLEMRR